jgi:hypothetical protein
MTVRDRQNRQRVTEEWLAELSDPFALAIWFMDVGDLRPLYQNKRDRNEKFRTAGPSASTSTSKRETKRS